MASTDDSVPLTFKLEELLPGEYIAYTTAYSKKEIVLKSFPVQSSLVLEFERWFFCSLRYPRLTKIGKITNAAEKIKRARLKSLTPAARRLYSTGILDGSDETNFNKTTSTGKIFSSGVGEERARLSTTHCTQQVILEEEV
uniref:Retrotransposon protein, putative, Ty3-gypsy subclass n=1 Tax=Oryza sativa subsp. japonica TaxID=39947 RepID=Q2QM07_ORYSJ|nr:retrotransposon protein, putative, Ty3-gypsy subclass [Oryza sativa Japonica Group]